MLRRFLKKIWYKAFKQRPDVVRASLIIRLLPKPIVARLWASRMTGFKPTSRITKFLYRQLDIHYYSRSEDQTRRLNRELVWGSIAGRRWHELKRTKYVDTCSLLSNRHHLLQEVSKLTEEYPKFKNLVEIGTGHGLFIELLYSNLPRIRRFIGLDSNATQIGHNKERERENTWSNPRIYVCRSERMG